MTIMTFHFVSCGMHGMHAFIDPQLVRCGAVPETGCGGCRAQTGGGSVTCLSYGLGAGFQMALVRSEMTC